MNKKRFASVTLLAIFLTWFWNEAGFAGQADRLRGNSDFLLSGSSAPFYAISSDSRKWWDLGLGRAPVEEPTPFNHGNGTDVVAVTYDSKGYVAKPPVYIYTITADSSQERKLQVLGRRSATRKTAENLFGRPSMRTELNGLTVYFYEIKVYNPFAEYPSRH